MKDIVKKHGKKISKLESEKSTKQHKIQDFRGQIENNRRQLQSLNFTHSELVSKVEDKKTPN